MRRTASEVIRNLEMRVARLEQGMGRTAGRNLKVEYVLARPNRQVEIAVRKSEALAHPELGGLMGWQDLPYNPEGQLVAIYPASGATRDFEDNLRDGLLGPLTPTSDDEVYATKNNLGVLFGSRLPKGFDFSKAIVGISYNK